MVRVADSGCATLIRRRHSIRGIVQGVGFRPFVYRLATGLGLTGWVRNTPAGLEIEVQGTAAALDTFGTALLNDLPPLAQVTGHISTDMAAADGNSFTILPSGTGTADIRIAPDSALCADCLEELFDPGNRRHRYPFITCTNCGPRYSIITGTPYDRPATTMGGFDLCPECLEEYRNPLDRRFHAQPIACHNCGPQVSLLTASGEKDAERDLAVTKAVEYLKHGNIVAIKGIGGFHLAVDACNHDAVALLRQRKKRDEKPFAVMAASLAAAREMTLMDDMEERLLVSTEAPIVIVRKNPATLVSPLIAPGNGWLGVMLPYAPLHHLIMRGNFAALVMTSGNISDEPVAYENNEALQHLSGIADYFLLHDRPIHIRSDDSVIRVFQGRPLFYRRARGFAPRAITLPFQLSPLLATGAELKNTICLAFGNQAVLSQHIGDLKNISTSDSFSHTIKHLSEILSTTPERIASDLHPDYISTNFAENSGLQRSGIQHHHAHMASCMAENGLVGEVIGIIFDGTGYGIDGTIWGGEFLTGGYEDFRRAAHFRPTPMPGGDAAVMEPWRMAMSYLYQSMGENAFSVRHPIARILSDVERTLFSQMLRRGLNSPLTSSCGRLFDAVAALLNIRHKVSYDGQAAIELEALAEKACSSASDVYRYELVLQVDSPIVVDFSQMFTGLLADLETGEHKSLIASRFHRTVATAATDICHRIACSTGIDNIVLSGGVFQNRLLSEMIYTELRGMGFRVFTHRLVPPNDGGIALGQAVAAGRRHI